MKKYRPSNGTEGEGFIACFCERCTKDNFPDENKPWCQILADTLAFDINDENYPKEWIWGMDGNPTCTAFEERKVITPRAPLEKGA